MEDKTKWLKNYSKDKTKTEPLKKEKVGLQHVNCFKTAWNLEERTVLPRKKWKTFKITYRVLVKNFKDKSCKLWRITKGKELLIYLLKFLQKTYTQTKYETNSWVREMLYRANVSVSFVDFSEFTVCMGCFRAVESWEPLPIYSTPVA